jgi:hypothetical protein
MTLANSEMKGGPTTSYSWREWNEKEFQYEEWHHTKGGNFVDYIKETAAKQYPLVILRYVSLR